MAEPGPPTCITCHHVHGEAFQHWCNHPNVIREEFDFVTGLVSVRRPTCRDQRESLSSIACGPGGKWWLMKEYPPLTWWQRLIDRIMR